MKTTASLATVGLLTLASLSPVSAQRYDGQFWPCNPSINATGACRPNAGLATSTYSIDFTKVTSKPDEWTISNYAKVPFGPNGAEFTFEKRYDAPQLWTNFMIFFGRVEMVMQVAPGTGIISSAVLMSDNFDEIDFEFSGNNFNLSSTGMGQNNYFGKGITGAYHRGVFFNVAAPQSQFHTYTVDWTPTQIAWSVDGVIVRTLFEKDCRDNEHQFPQTPSKFQLGMWDAGDVSANWGTVSWAGGYTDLSQAPFSMYVKSVKITHANPAYAYNYTDQSGKWQSIQLIQEPVGISTSTTPAPSTIAPSVSSSVMSQISSSLASKGEQLAGTIASPSATAVIGTTSITSQVTSIGSIPVSTAISSVSTTVPQTTSPLTSSSPTKSATSTSIAKPSTSTSVFPTSTATTCPGVNKKSISNVDGSAAYNIYCSADTGTALLGLQTTRSGIKGCIDLCDKTKGCTAFTYRAGNTRMTDGFCYLRTIGRHYGAGFLTVLAEKVKKVTSTSADPPPATSTSKVVSAPAASAKVTPGKKAAYTPSWHYWRAKGRWVRGWW